MPQQNEKELTAENQSYYDEDYFVKGSKRIVDENTGKETIWGYKGTDWEGHYHVVRGILDVFKGELGSVLDIGAGQGSFTDYALRTGLNVKGYDFSEWAVKNALNYAQGHLFVGDATNITEDDDSWDMIYCSDMLEHIKKSQVPKVIAEFHRVVRQWVFLQFPVAKPDEVFNFEKDGKEHHMYAHYMIAGHMNMQVRKWWDDLFVEKGFKVRDDLIVPFLGPHYPSHTSSEGKRESSSLSRSWLIGRTL